MRIATLLLVTSLALGSVAAASAEAGDREARGGRRAAFGGKFRKRLEKRRGEARDVLAKLGVTDDQRRFVLEKARQAAPIVESAKDEARRIVAKAWAARSKDPVADRAALRASVKADLAALRERTRVALLPLAKEVAGAITPEQRKALEEHAAAKGRTVDDARLERLATRLLARPMTRYRLEERLGR